MNCSRLFITIILTFFTTLGFAQEKPLKRVEFIIGDWQGTGQGFGNNKSKIESSFKWVMNKTYIEVINDSKFAPTKNNKTGEHHIDKGFISFDKKRNKIIYRQFNIEGFVNQYVLIDSISDNTKLVFETEKIENFVRGGKARLEIKKLSNNKLETSFFVAFPNKKYSCFGVNKLSRKQLPQSN